MGVMEKINGLISIMRPHLAVMTLTLAAVVGLLATYSTKGRLPYDDLFFIFQFVLVVIATYFAVVASYVFNDCCDMDIDKLNFPERALPSTSLKQGEAIVFSFVLLGISLAIFFYLSFISFILVIMATVIIDIYSKFLKRKTHFSFLPVGISYGLVPVGVWFAFTNEISLVPIFFGLMICITDWGFTNSDAARDVEGDKKKGAPTFPVTFGIPATTKLIITCWFIGILLSFGIWYATPLSYPFLIFATIAGGWMLVKSAYFYRNPKPDVGGKLFLQASKYRGILFLAMIADIILILLDVWPEVIIVKSYLV
jgi:4-hydroxybenzoate polyprenyltransferase